MATEKDAEQAAKRLKLDVDATENTTTSTTPNTKDNIKVDERTPEKKYRVPLYPPEAPREDTQKLGMLAEEARRHGIKPKPRDYTSADSKLWTKQQFELFKEKKSLHDIRFASGFMRWWFAEHSGMPGEPDKPLKSAFAYYRRDKFAEVAKANKKKASQILGSMWKQLSEEESAVYTEIHKKAVDKFDVDYDEYEKDIAAWRQEKIERLKKENEEMSNTARRKLGKEMICTCAYCEGDEHETPIALP
eukprot:m.32378 g.32378  ORF g.32378 m.32378 type:complete len:247 (-) comp8404_c0_seq1:63-803(-)